MRKKSLKIMIPLLLLFSLLMGCTMQPSKSGGNGSSEPKDGPVKCHFSVSALEDNSGQGRINSSLPKTGGSYQILTEIKVEAITEAGSSFVGWYDASHDGRLVSGEAIYNFTLTRDIALYARFASGLNLHSLSVTRAAGGNGSGRITNHTPADNNIYPKNSTITLEAIADSGSFFMGWYDAPRGGNIVSKESRYSFNLTANTLLYARFDNEKIKFKDPALERLIRKKINKQVGELTYSDVSGITQLSTNWNNQDKISDLSGIEYLTSLTDLLLSYNSISDLTPITNLTTITWINLSHNLIKDLSPLSKMTEVTSLDMSSNLISNISPLKKMTKMVNLDLSFNSITEISPLENMILLGKLELNSNKIANISALSKMTALEQLFLGNNKNISDITPLANLINIDNLDLRDNQISDISSLSKLTKLRWLHLSYNKEISDISTLANMKNIESIDLRDNQISDISPISHMTGLTKLYLNDNRIEDISPLANFINLTVLDLHRNLIVDISPLAKMTKLEELNLALNPVRDFSTLINSPGIGSGDTISLTDSPDLPVEQIDRLEAKGVTIVYAFYLY